MTRSTIEYDVVGSSRNLNERNTVKLFTLTTIAAVSLLAVGCSTTGRRNTSWEYTMAGSKDAAALKQQLNVLGHDGWEFVGIYPEADGWNQTVLKRAKK